MGGLQWRIIIPIFATGNVNTFPVIRKRIRTTLIVCSAIVRFMCLANTAVETIGTFLMGIKTVQIVSFHILQRITTQSRKDLQRSSQKCRTTGVDIWFSACTHIHGTQPHPFRSLPNNSERMWFFTETAQFLFKSAPSHTRDAFASQNRMTGNALNIRKRR